MDAYDIQEYANYLVTMLAVSIFAVGALIYFARLASVALYRRARRFRFRMPNIGMASPSPAM